MARGVDEFEGVITEMQGQVAGEDDVAFVGVGVVVAALGEDLLPLGVPSSALRRFDVSTS
jgi:hypothetical protein